MNEKLAGCQESLKINFRNIDLLKTALTHPSFHEGRDQNAHRQFERMELFGDALLNFILTEELLRQFPDLDEGQLSKFRSTLVSREALLRVVASPLNLHQYILVGPGETVKTPREKGKILADMSEAIFAAIYYDQGIEPLRTLILSFFNPHLTQERIHRIAFNAKGALQEEVQKRTQHLPEYAFERKGNKFICRVSGGPELGSAEGEGASKKEAAQRAAAVLFEKVRSSSVPAPTLDQTVLAPSPQTEAPQAADPSVPSDTTPPPFGQAPVGAAPPHRTRPYPPRHRRGGRRFRPSHGTPRSPTPSRTAIPPLGQAPVGSAGRSEGDSGETGALPAGDQSAPQERNVQRERPYGSHGRSHSSRPPYPRRRHSGPPMNRDRGARAPRPFRSGETPPHHSRTDAPPARPGRPVRTDRNSTPRRPHGTAGPSGRPPLEQAAAPPGRRPPRQQEESVDWRSWQSSLPSKNDFRFAEEDGEKKKKPSWSDHLRKLTGRIRKKKTQGPETDS